MKSYTLLCLLASLLPAQRLTITSGTAEEQVFQRSETNRATITLSGSATDLNHKPVEIRAIGKNGLLAALDWMAAGKVATNKWTAKITLPTGGPYRIEVRSAASVEAIGGILVGDLWVLAEEPLHQLPAAADRVHWRRSPKGQPDSARSPTGSSALRHLVQ